MPFSLLPPLKAQYFDDNGNPLSNGKLYSFIAGSSTPIATFTDASGGTMNSNPIVLNSRGEADVWISSSVVYKFVLTTSNDDEVYTVDNVRSQGGGSGSGVDELVKVSLNDTQAGYLASKLVGSDKISLSVLNEGDSEQLQIILDQLNASDINNDSGVTGDTVKDALNTLSNSFGGYVTISTPQTITGKKTFEGGVVINNSDQDKSGEFIGSTEYPGVILDSALLLDITGQPALLFGSEGGTVNSNYILYDIGSGLLSQSGGTRLNLNAGEEGGFSLIGENPDDTDLGSEIVATHSTEFSNLTLRSRDFDGGDSEAKMVFGSGSVSGAIDSRIDFTSDVMDFTNVGSVLGLSTGVASFYTQTFIEADLLGRVLTITHNLDSEDILLTLFDANKKVYIPDEYQVIDANNVEVTIDETVVGINKIVACANAQSASGSNDVQNRIIVNQTNVTTTLGGTIDSTKEYFIDGQIDMGTTQITVPASGMTLTGYNFDLSALYSSENNYTMFISDVGGSGNILGRDYEIRVTGTGSKVYDITDANGFNAFEFARVNYSDCTSLGEITGYRQGLENGTGRFGGSPSLTLSGTWLGGYRVVTSIVRSMSDTTTEPLFKAGAGFTMASRFATDMNVDLGDLQPLLDFSPSNFVNSSTLQLQEVILTRGGALDPTDTNITPNIASEDLASYWKRNVGLSNTYVGGTITVISEALTTISAVDTWTDLEGIFLGTGLQHFSSNVDGELTHDGVSPREFEFTGSFIIESNPNRSLSIRFNKWDASASVFTPLNYTIQTRTVNSLVGGRDVALFVVDVGGELDQGDYLKIQVRNNTDSNNVTLESSSFYRVQER